MDKQDRFSRLCFPQPQDKSTRVWRYLDLAKFIWLLYERKLFLSRLDLLNDPHEGSATQSDTQVYKENVFGLFEFDEFSESLSQCRQDFRLATYVSCWHMSKTESHAMWELYCGTEQGIAIQTTYEKLESSITDPEMYIGSVEYIDYDRDSFSQGKFIPWVNDSLMYAVMHKRDVFACESEVRIIKTLFDPSQGAEGAERPLGITMDWNLEEVIEHIYIHPYAPPFYFDVVKAVVSKFTPNLGHKLQWSRVKREPFY